MVWFAVIVVVYSAWFAWYLPRKRCFGNDGIADLFIPVIVAIRIWLGNTAPLFSAPAAPFDDRVFLLQATTILQGEWLGAYNDFTLIKGPLYSMYLALISWTGLGLTKSYVVVYAIGAWLVLMAIRQTCRSLGVGGQIFVFCSVLFCPVLVDTVENVRTWRQPLWCALCLIVVAACAGLTTSRGGKLGNRLRWAALLGVGLGCSWLTREEAIWLLAPTMLSLVLLAARCWNTCGWATPFCLSLLPLLLAPLLVLGVMLKNLHSYGFFGVVEMRGSAFVEAYSALARVAPFEWERRIPVSREARMRVYEISPAFREIREELEEGVGLRFMQSTEKNVGIPVEEGQIAGGWMLWALRTAVARSGYRWSMEDTEDFYRRLAAEVNEACGDGRLECLPPRVSMTPRLDFEVHSKPFLGAVWGSLKRSFDYRVNLFAVSSLGTEEDFEWVEALSNEGLSRPVVDGIGGEFCEVRFKIWSTLVFAYQWVGRFFAIGASVLLPAVFLVVLFVEKRIDGFGSIAILAASGIIMNACVVALVHITSWDAIGVGYLGASISLSTIPLALGGIVMLQGVKACIVRLRATQRIEAEHTEEERK